MPDSGAIDPAIVHLYGAVPSAVAATIVAMTKELARTVPCPPDDPYYGLDRTGGPSLAALRRLTRHGDFRKYVFVLDAGSGLGGTTRWLALRYGCRVLGLEACSERARTAHRLSERLGLDGRVQTVTGSFEAIPVADGVFTQIWSVETLHHATSRRRALAELYRVLRPGSPLALQEIVRADDSVPQLGGPWRHGTREEYLEALDAVGFRHVTCDDVTGERDEPSPVVLSAQEQLTARLETELPADAPWHEARRVLAAAADAMAPPAYRVVQLFARRPSV